MRVRGLHTRPHEVARENFCFSPRAREEMHRRELNVHKKASEAPSSTWTSRRTSTTTQTAWTSRARKLAQPVPAPSQGATRWFDEQVSNGREERKTARSGTQVPTKKNSQGPPGPVKKNSQGWDPRTHGRKTSANSRQSGGPIVQATGKFGDCERREPRREPRQNSTLAAQGVNPSAGHKSIVKDCRENHKNIARDCREH